MDSRFYVKVEVYPGYWVADSFRNEEACEFFFAKYPAGKCGYKYRWEEISEEEYLKRKGNRQ